MTEQLFNVSVRVWLGVHDPSSHSELASALLDEMDGIIEAMTERDSEKAQITLQNAVDYYTARLRKLI